MKKICVALLLLPQIALSQSAAAPRKSEAIELSFNVGYAPDNAFKQEPWRGGFIRSALGLLRTRGTMQYGLSIEGGTNSNDYWYLTPGVIVNHKFADRANYLYAGAMAGYVISGDMIPVRETRPIQGYVLGVQAGLVHPVGRRLSLSSELAVRSTQMWAPAAEGQTRAETDFILYFPVTIGLRYRL